MAGELENVIVWREAIALAASILALCDHVKGRAKNNFCDQIVRASEAIPANIAEGIARGVSRDCLRFLRIARSSGQEVDSHLQQARISKRLTPAMVDPAISHTRRVRFLLRKFQESVERRLRETEGGEGI